MCELKTSRRNAVTDTENTILPNYVQMSVQGHHTLTHWWTSRRVVDYTLQYNTIDVLHICVLQLSHTLKMEEMFYYQKYNTEWVRPPVSYEL